MRVDHSALLRGYALDGETCELAGFGPVSPQVVADIMQSGDPFYKAIATKGKDVVGVAHLGRRPNAHQRSALDWLYPSCAAEGCGVRSRYCQTDHRTDWAATHVTVFDLLDRLCKFHHDLKTYQGWGLVQGKGKRAFVPPEDPRHPRHGPSGRDGPPPPPPPAPGPRPGRARARGRRRAPHHHRRQDHGRSRAPHHHRRQDHGRRRAPHHVRRPPRARPGRGARGPPHRAPIPGSCDGRSAAIMGSGIVGPGSVFLCRGSAVGLFDRPGLHVLLDARPAPPVPRRAALPCTSSSMQAGLMPALRAARMSPTQALWSI